MQRNMRLILDTNEYIFGLNPGSGRTASIQLLEAIGELLAESPDFTLFVPEIVREEVQRNLAPAFVGDFYRYVTSSPQIVFGSLYDVPVALFEQYHLRIGLKQADAIIAAFADWVDADFLVSDNRHIYAELQVSQFITCTAPQFMAWLESGQLWRTLAELRARKGQPQ